MAEYQGKSIDRMEITVRGMAGHPSQDNSGQDLALQIDDVVNLRVEGRVTGSKFDVDKEGHLVQTFYVKPVDVGFQPWNVNDPDDDGVSRWNARQGQAQQGQVAP